MKFYLSLIVGFVGMVIAGNSPEQWLKAKLRLLAAGKTHGQVTK